MTDDQDWPELPLEAWQDTYATLHMWTQIIGKIRLAQMPYLNHWWNATLYVTANGLTTSVMPYGKRAFQIDVDLCNHLVRVSTDRRDERVLPLRAQSVAEFYAALMRALAEFDLDISIDPRPVEVPPRKPLSLDRDHASYDPVYAERFFHALWQAQRVMAEFRGRFLGKASPPHFFWGAFDLATTRFSGRSAPAHGPVPYTPHAIVAEAYSHEVSSCGFWPGTPGFCDEAAFYAYAYPEPSGFSSYPIAPADAHYSKTLGEFILPYAAVRSARDPDAMLLDFLQSTYEAAAETGAWKRDELEHGAAPTARMSRSA
jgi:hypothetical protein